MPARLKPLLAALRRWAAILIITLGALSSLAYLLTPLLADWRDDLAGYLSEQIGRPVSIGGLQTRWRGIGPALQLKDLVLGDPQAEDSLRLERVDLDVGLLDMLLHRNLSPLRITLHRLQLHLVRQADGSIQLAGLNQQTSGADDNIPLVLPDRLRLRDTELVWEDRKKGLPPIRIPRAQLDLDSRGGRLHVAAKLSTGNAEPNHILLIADLDSAPWSADWSGDLYLSVEGLNSQTLPQAYLPEPYRLLGVAQELEVWSHWRKAELQQVQGQVRLLDIEIGYKQQQVQLDDLRSRFLVERLEQGWTVQLDDFSLSHKGISWPSGSLALQSWRDSGGTWTIQLGADFLRLQDLVALYRLHPVEPTLPDALQRFSPRGDLHQLQLQLRLADKPSWQFAARAEGLSSKPWNDVPGISGLSGMLLGNNRELNLQLDSTQVAISFTDLFRDPLGFDNLKGTLAWQRMADGGWSAHSDEIIAYNADIYTRSRLALSAPAGKPDDLSIDLQMDFRDGVATTVPHYLPAGIMGDPLVEWLDQAFVSGRVPSGTLLLRGALNDFPFERGHSGHFEVLFGVEELVLNYLPGWPQLIDATAELRFHNNSLDIGLQHGRIYDSEVKRAHARIAQLDPTSVLQVRGLVHGPLGDPLRLLGESPLKADFGDLVTHIQGSGQSELTLDFDLVLDEIGKDRLDGKLRFLEAGIKLPEWDLAIDRLQGELQMDLDGVRGEGLRGTALGSTPIIADVAAGEDGRTWINTRAKLDIASISQRLPDLPLKWAKGEAEFQIRVGVPGKADESDTPALLVVESDLVGIGLNLPAPLDKQASARRRLKLSLPLADGDGIVALRYADWLNAAFTKDGRRTGIRFGGATATLPTGPGVHLRGELAELDLEPWLSLKQDGRGAGALPPLSTDLRFGKLRLGQLAFDDIELRMREKETGWEGQAGGENFSGEFLIPSEPGSAPIQLRLERLALSHKPEERQSESAQAATDQATSSPMDWPELDFQCTQLFINDKLQGSLNISLRKTGEGVKFEPLSLSGENIRLRAEAGWQRLDGKGAGESYLRGDLQSKNFGKLLLDLGFSEQLKKADSKVSFDLSWPGAPQQMAIANMVGDLDLRMEKGVFVEVEPGVSRVFGLLNIGALQRRLSLDFRDLYGKGFSFDDTSGSFQLDHGDAYTNNLIINGPSGEIDIAGRTGLIAQDFDQLVTVKPELGAALPIAVGTAAGPVAGVAVWLAQELIKAKEIDEFQRFQYSVKGPWDKPEVKQLDSGGTLSNLLKPITEGLLGTPTEAKEDEESLPE